MASPGKDRSSTYRASNTPRREPIVEAKLPRATTENSLLLKLLHDCPLEARVAVHRVAHECSQAGANNLYQRERAEQIARRERAEFGSSEYDTIQREINEHAERGVGWQADRTPMRLLERLGNERLGGSFDVESAKVSDLWNVVATYVVVEQKDLTVYGIPEFMLSTAEVDAEGSSRRAVADLLKAQLSKGMIERVLACTRRLASRSPTQRVRDELAALDVLPRVYRGLDILVGSQEADDPEIRKVVLSEIVPLVRDMSLNWPCGAITSTAELARDQAAGGLLAVLGECDAGVPASAIDAMRRTQSMLRSALLGIVEFPVEVPVRNPKSLSVLPASAESKPETEWRNTKWIIEVIKNENRSVPVSLGSRLRAFAKQMPQPSCVSQARPNAPYLFELHSLCNRPEFNDIKALLGQALKTGFILPRQRKPKSSKKKSGRKRRSGGRSVS